MKTTTLIISAGFVAGVPHRNPDLSVVATTDSLRLEPEPTNAYDPDAVKIIHVASGQFLGYVPREQNCAIHQALKEGFKITCVVGEVPLIKWKEIHYIASITVQLPEDNEAIEDGEENPKP